MMWERRWSVRLNIIFMPKSNAPLFILITNGPTLRRRNIWFKKLLSRNAGKSSTRANTFHGLNLNIKLENLIGYLGFESAFANGC